MPESPLSKERLQQFREALLDKRRPIVDDVRQVRQEQLGRGGPAGRMASRAATHPADEAMEERGRSPAKRQAQTEHDMVLEIDEALQRIGQGAHGLCDEGGEPVAMERLIARPWTRLRLKHAAETEQRAISTGVVGRSAGRIALHDSPRRADTGQPRPRRRSAQ